MFIFLSHRTYSKRQPLSQNNKNIKGYVVCRIVLGLSSLERIKETSLVVKTAHKRFQVRKIILKFNELKIMYSDFNSIFD